MRCDDNFEKRFIRVQSTISSNTFIVIKNEEIIEKRNVPVVPQNNEGGEDGEKFLRFSWYQLERLVILK